MTISDAIHLVDRAKSNGCGMDEKLRWLSVLDGNIQRELIDTHEGAEKTVFLAYGEETPLNTVLLAAHPYDEIYIRFLEAQIDYVGGEYEKYNNSIALFNAAWEAYEKFYRRTHKPKGKRFIHF